MALSVLESAVQWLWQAEHEIERYLLDDNKIDAVEAIPWVLCSAIIWSVLSLALDKNPYFVSSWHAAFLSAAAGINLWLGHNEHEYVAFYVMTGYFISDFFLRESDELATT
jgi:hypothetical protein